MEPNFDLSEAHRYFSTTCFNQAWQLIEMPQRTEVDTEEMIHLSLASLWHWTQRADVTPTNMSIGFWLVSRVYSLAGQGENALRYAENCLEASQVQGVNPFYLAYAYEAVARAKAVMGDLTGAAGAMHLARQNAEVMEDPGARQQLYADLAALENPDFR